MLTDTANMDSIWVEDGLQGLANRASKLRLNDPNVQIVNSEIPILSSKKHIDLPPLPPSSYFSYVIKEDSTPKKNGFLKLFKKSSTQSLRQQDKRAKQKISTPFGFNHISHIDNQGSVINVNKMAEITPIDPTDLIATDQITEIQSPTSGSKSNRTSTSAKAFCTSPQINPSKNLPRSISNATSISRSSSTQIFERSISISTMATSISSNTHSKKDSILMGTSANTTQSTTSHQHQKSSDSIENLKKLEKNQISKQCSVDYSSNYKFPSTNSTRNLNNWGTPDPESAVRQSWIYEDLSPRYIKKTPLKRSNSVCGSSPILHSPYNVKRDLSLFQDEVETCFNDADDEANLDELISSIDDFTRFFKKVPETESQSEDDEDIEELAMRAARFSRLSRLDSFYQNDPRYLSLLDEFQKRSTIITTTTDASSATHQPTHSKNQSLQISEISETGPLELGKYLEVPEISELSESEEESTPRQHHISTLLPSMM